MDEAINIGSRRELLLDDFLTDRRSHGAQLRLHHPEVRETAIVFDKPWEGRFAGAFSTVMPLGDRYRLYYRGWHAELSEGNIDVARPLSICVAESPDGINWERLRVNAFDFLGDRSNNIVWMGEGDDCWGTHGFAPFIDTSPDCPPDKRWKAVGGGMAYYWKGLYLMTSADGVTWQLASNQPFQFIPGAKHGLDSHNTILWSPEEGCYRAYFRHRHGDGPTLGPRIIMTGTSTDLLHWDNVLDLEYGSVCDYQLYTNNVAPYYRAPHIRLGFPLRYVERDWSPTVEAWPELEHRRLRSGISMRYGTAVTEPLFMSSRNGVDFRRWEEAFIRPGLRALGSWTYGDGTPAWGLVETESGLPGGGRELSVYAVENYWRGIPALRRHTLRLDGFVSLSAPMSGGEMLTKPLVFTGLRLSLNISTSAAGCARVEVQDFNGTPIPGFTLDDCWDIVGDTLDYAVCWKQGPNVGALAGQPVRLRFELKDADLYSFCFG